MGRTKVMAKPARWSKSTEYGPQGHVQIDNLKRDGKHLAKVRPVGPRFLWSLTNFPYTNGDCRTRDEAKKKAKAAIKTTN